MSYVRSSFLIPGLSLTMILFAGCTRAAPNASTSGLSFTGPGWFVDATADVGIDFVHDAGLTNGSYFLPQINGSGAALFDFDGDGRLDILFLQGAGPDSSSKNRLFKQLTGGKFQDVSAGSGLDFAGYNTGVAVGDVNNDGLPDVLITQYGGARLFLNQGGGKFKDVTKEAGLNVTGWCTSAAFFDYDRDGWLDLVVVRYVDYSEAHRCRSLVRGDDYCTPAEYSGTVSQLFHNRGRQADGGVRFEDVTRASGLGALPGPGLGVVCADFDGDGWPDIFVADDGQPNRLWMNQKNGTFKEEAVKRGVAFNANGAAEANMGIACGDVNGDGLADLFVTHVTAENNRLWLQGPPGRFQDSTQTAGLDQPRWRATGFGTVLGDFANNGALDLAVVNGRVDSAPPADNPDLDPYWRPYAERNQLFANDSEGRFKDVSLVNAPFCQIPRVTRGLAVGDVFNDGGLALLTTEIDGPAHLYRNAAVNRGHWLTVRAVDPALRRDAYGAKVVVHAAGRRWVRWIDPAGSFQCSSDPRAHFGLGPVDRIESVEILWPDGRQEIFDGGPTDRLRELRRGEGRPADAGLKNPPKIP